MKTRQRILRRFLSAPQWLRHLGRNAALSLSLVAAAALAGPVTKNPEPTVSPDPWWPGMITTGVKGNDAHIDGHFSITAPIYSTLGADGTLSGDLIFLEPYISHGEGGEVATSLGLGWRHLFGSQSVSALSNHDGHQAGFMEEGWFIGANVFVDMLDTETDHQFWQLGVGAEIGNRYIEVRGNYYIPLTEKQEVDRFRTRESFSSSRTSHSTALNAQDPFATGNTIQQAYTQSVFATTTTRTTTIERLFRRYEEGMEGWDAEIAILVPGVDKYMDLRLIAGYYSFENQPFGPQSGGTGDIEGWKAGVEVRPVPALILSGMWYEDDRLTGSDWTIGVQMQIPFEGGDLGDGKNLWSRIGDSFKPRRRHLAERMAEPVRRQNAAIKLAGSTEEDKKEREVTSKVKKVTKLVSQSQHQIVLKDDIIFVNNGGPVGNGIQAGSAAGDGTAEKPLADIQAGGNRAQVNSQLSNRIWNVYTQGTAAGYTENVVANTGSVNFIGSGKLISGIGGKTFGAGPAPRVQGGFLADGIAHFGVEAYHITGGYFGDYGIGAHNVGFAHLSENTLISTLGGVALRVDGTAISQALVEGNTIQNNTLSGVSGQVSGEGRLEALVQNNRISNMGDSGVSLSFEDIARGVVDLVNNEIQTTGGHGVDVQGIEATRVAITLERNRITGAQDSGVSVRSINSSTMVLTANQNIVQQSANQAFDFLANDGTLTAGLTGNQMLNSGGSGINAVSDFGISRLFLRATGNIIDTTGAQGIWLQAPTGLPGSALTGRLTGNQIRNAGGSGISVSAEDDHDLDILISSNLVEQAGENGIVIQANGVSGKVEISENTVKRATIDGIAVTKAQGGSVHAFIEDNVVNETGNYGVLLRNGSAATLSARVDRNQLSTIGSYGVLAEATSSGNMILFADGNKLENIDGSGLYVLGTVSANVMARLTNNEIFNAGGDGIETFAGGTAKLTLLAEGNTTSGNDFGGITVGLEDSATGVIDVINNTMSNNLGAHLYLDAGDNTTVGYTARGNHISEGGNNGGMALYVYDTATGSLVIEDNEIFDQVHGIHVDGNVTTQATLTGNAVARTAAIGIYVEGLKVANIVGNTVTDAGAASSKMQGIYASVGTDGSLDISNNTVVGSDGTGISAVGGQNTENVIKNNTVNDNRNGGVYVVSNNGLVTKFEITGNQLANNLEHAIAAFSEDTSTMEVTVTGNAVNTTFFGSGIHFEALDTSTMTGMASNNSIFDSDRSGVTLITRNGATAHYTVADNTITQTNNSAVQTFSSDTSIMTANIQNNSLLGTRGNVVYLETLTTSNQTVTVAGNTIVGSDFRGLILNGLFSSTLNVVWDNNNISAVGRLGDSAILVKETDSSTVIMNSNANNVVVPHANAEGILESTGDPSGTIILNGAPVVLPATVP